MGKLLPFITIEPAMRPSLLRLALATLLSSACCAVFAQYVWIDANGVKQYSDVPPPSSVPASRILKTPGPATTQPVMQAPDAAPSAPPSLAEREAEFQKRRAAAEEKRRAEEQQAQLETTKKSVCEAARAQKRALESGERLWRIDANGERRYFDDADRAAQLREVQRALQACS
jgi:type IV secretory pathway VirB10-like protein